MFRGGAKGGLALAVTLAMAATPASAGAADFEVTRTDDPSPPGACLAGDCSLREAVLAANATLGEDDVITLGAETYTLSIPGTGENAGATGDLDIAPEGALEIVGAGSQATTIDAGGIDRALQLTGGVDLELIGITITGGDPSATADPLDRGGGAIDMPGFSEVLIASDVHLTGNQAVEGGGVRVGDGGADPNTNEDPILIALDSAVVGNTSSQNGGGAFIGDQGRIAATRTVFDDNTSQTGSGGAIDINEAGRFTLVEGSISGNDAPDAPAGSGGGIFQDDQARSVIRDSILDDNTANRGGFLYNSNQSTAVVTGSSLSGNSAESGGGAFYIQNESQFLLSDSHVLGSSAERGGGLYLQNDSLSTIDRVTVRGNDADDEGGGFFVQNDAVAIIRDSAIVNNAALGADEGGGGLKARNNANVYLTRSLVAGNEAPGAPGGGISTAAISTSVIVVDNSTLSGNSAAEGGGIHAEDDDLRLTVRQSTVTGNAATTGAGISVAMPEGRVRLGRSLVAGNQGPDCSGAIDSLGFNLGDGCGFDRPTDVEVANPRLRPLAQNGGPTATHAPRPGSALIDRAGATCPLATDQRGFGRPNGPRCDIGAFELDQSFGGNPRVRLGKVKLVGDRLVARAKNNNAFPVQARLVLKGKNPKGNIGAAQRILPGGKVRPFAVRRKGKFATGAITGKAILRLKDPNGGTRAVRRPFSV